MKKSLFASLAAVVFAAACTTTNPTVEPKLTVEGLKLDANKTVNVAAAASDLTFTVNANVTYTIVSDKDWAVPAPAVVEAENNADKTTSIKIGITANGTEEARTAKISIIAEENASLGYEFTISQAAAVQTKSLSVYNTDLTEISGAIEVESTDASASVMVVSTVSWTATPSEGWITVEPASLTVENYEETPATVSLKIADNPDEEVRSATVTFSGEGIEPVTVTVNQAAKIVYRFAVEVRDITYTGATIICEPSDADVHYLLSCESASYVNQFETGADLAAADMEYFRGEYGSDFAKYGFDSYEALFLNGLCKTGSSDWTLSTLKQGTGYVAYVFAVDESLNVVSDVVKKEFTTQTATASDAYNKWLGNWKCTDGTNVNNITVSLKTPDAEYSISGLQGFTDLVDAKFNAESGTLSILPTDLEDYTHNSYGPIDLWFFATFLNGEDSSFITGDSYVICTATMTDDTHASAEGSNITLSDNTTVTVSGMGFCGLILEGQYAGYSLGYQGTTPSIPFSMEKSVNTQSNTKVTRKTTVIPMVATKAVDRISYNCVELR